MKVKLLYYTPIEVAYYSAKTCYSAESAIIMSEEDKTTKEQKIDFIKNVLKTGHESTVEGINFTLLIEDVSRSLLAQLTRHRIGIQFSVQSQRYVKYNKDTIDIYTPPTILENKEALTVYNEIQEKSFEAYERLLNLGIKPEDARYVLTNGVCTNITMTVNLRALRHIMGLRLCNRASLEIRQLMKMIKSEILKKEPWLDEHLIPQCEHLGFCPEIKSCGKRINNSIIKL